MCPEGENISVEHQVIVDRIKLNAIAATVDAINAKVDKLVSHDGPISQTRERLAVVKRDTDRAHERIDHLEDVNERRDVTLNGLAIKVAGLSALLTGSLVAGVMKLLG